MRVILGSVLVSFVASTSMGPRIVAALRGMNNPSRTMGMPAPISPGRSTAVPDWLTHPPLALDMLAVLLPPEQVRLMVERDPEQFLSGDAPNPMVPPAVVTRDSGRQLVTKGNDMLELISTPGGKFISFSRSS